MRQITLPLTLLLLFTVVQSHGQNITVSGEVSGVWDADTIKMMADITLPVGEILIIDAGTIVECHGPFRFYVNGSVNALGSEEKPILFTIIDTVEMYNPNTPRGGWKGFYINELNRADSLHFSYCKFLYGKAWEEEVDATGGLFNIFNSSNIYFNNCEFGYSTSEYMGGAMYLNGSNVEFENCHFYHNKTGIDIAGYGGAVAAMGGDLKWNYCLFEYNQSNGLGGAMCFLSPEQSQVKSSIFQNNTGSTGGAIFFLNSSNTIFHNNLMTNNNGYYFGGALGLKNTSFPIINCTIADNNGGQGGSIYCSSGVSNPVYNTIITGNDAIGNGEQVYIAYLESTLSFYHCVVESGREAFGGSGGWYPGAYHGEYINNIEEKITFTSIPELDYAIAEPNPAINSGYTDTITALIPQTDILEKTRIVGAAIDLGCYEYDQAFGICESKNTNQINAYPNPFQEHIEIHISESVTAQNIFIYNSQGQIIKKIGLFGQKSITWNSYDDHGNNLPSGLYFLSAEDGHFTTVIKN